MKKTLFVLASLLAISSFASAAIDFGDLPGTTVVFETVQTSNDGYFGTPVVSGDSLIFTPSDFGVQATGAGGVELKDGQMLTFIQANEGRDIDSVEIEEFGDYSLIGSGGVGTWAKVSGAAFVTVLEVEGVELANAITFTDNMVYTPSAGDYDLLNDGVALAEIWEGELKFNLDALLLGEGITGKATRVYFTMDNTLAVTSEDGTSAFIKKKLADAFVLTVPVPEPATLALLGLGGLMLRRRK